MSSMSSRVHFFSWGRRRGFRGLDGGNEGLEVLVSGLGCQVSGGAGGLWHSASMLRLMFGVCQKDNASVLAVCGVSASDTVLWRKDLRCGTGYAVSRGTHTRSPVR